MRSLRLLVGLGIIIFLVLVLIAPNMVPRHNLATEVTRSVAARHGLSIEEVELLAKEEIDAYAHATADEWRDRDLGRAGDDFLQRHGTLFAAVGARLAERRAEVAQAEEERRAEAARAEREAREARFRSPHTWGGDKMMVFQESGETLFVEVYIESYISRWFLLRTRLAKIIPALFEATDRGFTRAQVKYRLPAAQQVDEYGNPLENEQLTTLAVFNADLPELSKYNRESAERGPLYVADRMMPIIHPDVRAAWREEVANDKEQFLHGRTDQPPPPEEMTFIPPLPSSPDAPPPTPSDQTRRPNDSDPAFAVEVEVPPGSATGRAYLRIAGGRLDLGEYDEDCGACGLIDIGTVAGRRLTHPDTATPVLFFDWESTPGGNGGVVRSGFLLMVEGATVILGRGEFISMSGDEGVYTPARGGRFDVQMTAKEVVVTVRQTYVNSGWFDKEVPRTKERDTIAEGTIRCSFSLDGRLTRSPIAYRIVDDELARAFSLSPQPDQFIRRRLEEACTTAE